jgi:Fe-S-cluster containining protein
MKLGRNDPCSCGSGEKHKRCCGSGHPQTRNGSAANEDRRWVEENVIKDGDVLFYGVLHDEMENIPSESLWKEFRRIAQIYRDAAEDRTRIVHQLVDTTIDSLIERDKRFGYSPPFCHKGCGNCCHELVYCTSDEAARIHEYCEGHAIEIDHAKLSRQLDAVEFDHAMDHTGQTTWNDQDLADQSCAFLDPQANCCTIWPVRPLVCRVHLAEGSSDHCAPQNGVENPNSRGINYIELSYILSVVFTIHRDSIKKTMGRLLLDLKQRGQSQHCSKYVE